MKSYVYNACQCGFDHDLELVYNMKVWSWCCYFFWIYNQSRWEGIYLGCCVSLP